jgi:hypothetical protein
MPTEDDLRVALRELERHTPEPADILRAVYLHPQRAVRSRRLPRRHVLRAGLALSAAGALGAAAVIAAAAYGPAPKAMPIAASTLRARLLSAISNASGDILFTNAPGDPVSGGQYPAYPRPHQAVRVRVGPARGSDGLVYKDGEYFFKMPSAKALHRYISHYTADLDQGGLQLSGTVMWVDHRRHVWGRRHSTFVFGFTLDAAGIRAEIANGQFTIVGRTEVRGHRAIELKINVPPNDEAPPHVIAEQLWVDATTYLPMRGYTRMSNGKKSVSDYVFLPPTQENLAKLRLVIPPGYKRANQVPKPHLCRSACPPKPRTTK